MNLWFKQLLPYLVLVIFHLNSSQVDNQATSPSGDQPADPSQALYCPPGAPFGPVHFTKYLPNPAYTEYNLETILIANSLAKTRETEYIGCEGKWYERPPRLFKDKYNYLPAYFVPMTLPLTPQPNCPMETPTAAKTTSTQLFGVLYITLTGMVDTMVPNSGPWSLLRQSVSYIIKLAPILWWALPSGPTIFQPEPNNASIYAWLPETRPGQAIFSCPENPDQAHPPLRKPVKPVQKWCSDWENPHNPISQTCQNQWPAKLRWTTKKPNNCS
ncbi:hypothetical protein DSO57_1007595 [Entomophthora muscae]|uniref:Uncharacterized protein n=1 Tax=Entomophthora muscae TaxID=34485 RepID=A0ACC2RYE8_9FUNG|nr:hypothetical protein DSO57_1007595 [Entomophthora muscae]